MEIINVPAPPKEAFNKDRRISDLIRSQIKHLKHLEHQLPADLRRQLPQHEITTEDDAARYIRPMTLFFRSQSAAAAPPGPIAVKPTKPAAAPTPAQGLAIAAAAASPPKSSKPKPAAAKKAAAKSKANKR